MTKESFVVRPDGFRITNKPHVLTTNSGKPVSILAHIIAYPHYSQMINDPALLFKNLKQQIAYIDKCITPESCAEMLKQFREAQVKFDSVSTTEVVSE